MAGAGHSSPSGEGHWGLWGMAERAPDFEGGWWGWSECVWEGLWLWEREPCWRSCFPGSSPGLSIPNAQEMLIAQISPAWHGRGSCTCLDRSGFLSVISVSVEMYFYIITDLCIILYLFRTPRPHPSQVRVCHIGCSSAQQYLGGFCSPLSMSYMGAPCICAPAGYHFL